MKLSFILPNLNFCLWITQNDANRLRSNIDKVSISISISIQLVEEMEKNAIQRTKNRNAKLSLGMSISISFSFRAWWRKYLGAIIQAVRS